MITHRTESTDDDVELQRQQGDRRHLSLNQVALIVAMSAQFAAVIWNAATTTAAVNALRETMILVTTQVKETQATVNKLSEVVAVLKDRADKK